MPRPTSCQSCRHEPTCPRCRATRLQWREDLRESVRLDETETVAIEGLSGWVCRACLFRVLDLVSRRRYRAAQMASDVEWPLAFAVEAASALLGQKDDVCWDVCSDCGETISHACPGSHRGWVGTVCCDCYETTYCPTCNPTGPFEVLGPA